jgi:formylglycine-generating enzyme required for sulfatase activity
VGGQKGAVVRGGAWNEQGEIYGLAFLKPSTTLDYRGPNVGFRCVKAATGAGALPGMVLVPAGAFRKGSEDTRALRLGRQFRLSGTAIRQLIEAPAGRKRIEAFALDAHEVTIDEYRRFIATRGTDHSGCSSAERAAFPSGKDHTPDPSAWNDAAFNQPDQPVVGVDWYDAFAYCRSQQKRLPTEREWEAAARGREGRAYPWGDRFESDRCNAADSTQPLGRTSPVGSLRACRSPEGVYDLVGNADEWTASYAAGGTTGSSRYRTRGGSWAESGELRGLGYFAFVAEATYRRTDMGIRCAADLEPSWIERLMR